MRKLFDPSKGKMRVGILLSGTGSTARSIISSQGEYEVVCLFSDRESSKIKEIAQATNIPYLIEDIRTFYAKRELENFKDMGIRKEFDKQTSQWLRENRVHIVALAGYMSLVTESIFGEFLTINSHPGDLTIVDAKGNRRFVGIHAIREAIAAEEKKVCTSIILVNSGLDAGTILLRSKEIPVPKDADPKKLQETLKLQGDYPAYHAALCGIARGDFAIDDSGLLYYQGKRCKNGISLTA